jgi:hypothetical protein
MAVNSDALILIAYSVIRDLLFSLLAGLVSVDIELLHVNLIFVGYRGSVYYSFSYFMYNSFC